MPEPLRILFLLPSLQGGGAERVACSLLRHLDRGRFAPTLAVIDPAGAVYRDEIPGDIRVISLDSVRLRQALVKIVRLLWREKPDVVFSTLGHVNLALSMLRPLLPRGTRYVGRETTMVSLLPSPQYEPGPAWRDFAYRHFLHRLDAVVCQSRAMKSDIVGNYSVPSDKAYVIYNPVDAERVRRLAAEPIDTGLAPVQRSAGTIELVAAASFHPRKGLDLLVEAMALCSDRNLRLTVLGDGPLKDDVQGLAERLGVAGRIRFLGFQRNPYPFIAQADAFVLSSRFEGLPNVVLEAMACGTPVISTPAPGGVSEILAGVEGCALAADVTAAALADAIRRFAFGRRLAADVVAPYAPGVVTRRFEDVFAGVV